MKQSAVVAVEKGIKARVASEGGVLHRNSQASAAYNGHTRRWQALSEDGEQFPPDSKRVKLNSRDVLSQFRSLMAEYFDITLTKDAGNQQAVADIVLDGNTVIAEAVPATTLIFLEKQLEHLHTFISKLPTLDEAEEWTYVDLSGLYRSADITTHKTQKVQRPIVLYDATEHHPAQTQLISEDVTIGHWHTTKLSGALPAPQKQTILTKITQLQRAVKTARSEANSTEVQRQHIGQAIFTHILE